MSADPPGPTRAELARELLRFKMMEYSEGFFCATWLVDLEFKLWESADIEDPSNPRDFVVALSKELRVLGEVAGGWWVYQDETRPDEHGPVFIPMERWQQILAERQRPSSD